MTDDEFTTVALGSVAGRLDERDVVLPVGPYNPAMHGALRLALQVDGDRVVAAEPVIGYLHRGAEKLFEVRDYRQILVLANRHDWLSAFASELAVALAVERLMGLELPERAVWTRTLLAELNRALHHLAHIAGDPLETGDVPAADAAHLGREVLQDVMEEFSGGRMHFMATQVGGLRHDIPGGWLDRVQAAATAVREQLSSVAPLVEGAQAERLRGVGVMDAATVAAYGVSGPAARAAGVALDLRRDEPYLAYHELDVALVSRATGDARDRFQCLLEEIGVALDLSLKCVERIRALPPGPIAARLPATVRAPVGHAYAWTENPSGINGYYLVSTGDRTPWRLKLRTASFNNVQALRVALVGCQVGDLVAVLSSLFVVVGDIDK